MNNGWARNSLRMNPFWLIWGSGESKSVVTLTIAFSHCVAFHHQENMISVSILIRQQKFHTTSRTE